LYVQDLFLRVLDPTFVSQAGSQLAQHALLVRIEQAVAAAAHDQGALQVGNRFLMTIQQRQ
jgi:hypothetical protein